MPILINSVDFTDNFGNTEGFYRSNAGDKITAKVTIEATIRMSSVGNPLTLDPSLNQVTSPGVSWIKEGFRVGDSVLVYKHSSGGAVIAPPFWTSITYVDDVMVDFTGVPIWYNIQNNEFMTLYAVVAPGSYTARPRAAMDLQFNHVKNTSPGGEFSLIDGEATRAIFDGIDLLAIGGSVPGILVGNQSGQFLSGATITRIVNAPSGFYAYELEIFFNNSGLYDPAWFQSSDCLKAWIKMLWASYAGEPFERTEGLYNLQANTGFFDEPNNSSINNSVLVQGVVELDYCIPTTFELVVNGPVLDLGIGSAYRSITDDYYRNRPEPQQELTMLVETQPLAPLVYISELNPNFAGYELEVNSIISVGTVHTISVTMTPDGNFNSFMAGREDGDRLFYLWIKCGNSNLLAFQNQLTCAPPVGGPLIIEGEAVFLDHCSNWDPHTGLEFPLPPELVTDIFDTEDDLASIQEFLLDKGQIYESLTVKIEAYNSVTDQSFTLQAYSYNFAGVQISGDGKYLLNLSQPLNLELPTTSNKRNGFFELRTNQETPTQYLVRVYAPWILNWRYWLPQLNASADFYPNQSKDWEQYDNLADWEIRTGLELIKEGLAYVHDVTLIDRVYDAEPLIDSTLEMFLEPALTPVNVVPAGALLRIVATHVRTDGNNWDPLQTWGMITVESCESQPRPICSSVVPFDNDLTNPLRTLSGPVIAITYPAPNIAVLACTFDSNLIDLSNGVSFTGKIKDKRDAPECIGMFMENDDCILLENDDNLTIE